MKDRVPGHDHAAIGFALDAGASIVLPQVETVEQAKHIVSAAKYGAKHGGSRSAPPFRLFPGLTDSPIKPEMSTFENQNFQAAIIIQIENEKGIDNLDAILTEVPDIDCVWLGSLDCRLSMGLAGMGGEEPEWLAAVERYTSILQKHNKPISGLALGGPEQKAASGAGKSFVVPCADVLALLGHVEELKEARSIFQPLKPTAKAVDSKVVDSKVVDSNVVEIGNAITNGSAIINGGAVTNGNGHSA
jgi:4-hydroxy-2-oxoheptanedioate aldolase